MCGRYASSRRDVELVDELEVDEVLGDPPAASWNVAPTQPARVVLERPLGPPPTAPRQRQLRTLRWGLIPSWATDAGIGARLINARTETITRKPAFQAAAARRRCLVPADGYYEWERRSGAGSSVPQYLHRDRDPLAFAGLYEIWRDPSVGADDPARWVWSFTIVTTRAPDALGHIHDRSPVVVPRPLRDAWLDPRLTDLADVRELLDVMPDPGLQSREVSTAVNDHRNNGPHLLRPLPAHRS